MSANVTNNLPFPDPPKNTPLLLTLRDSTIPIRARRIDYTRKRPHGPSYRFLSSSAHESIHPNRVLSWTLVQKKEQ